jgi:hypothetical protein
MIVCLSSFLTTPRSRLNFIGVHLKDDSSVSVNWSWTHVTTLIHILRSSVSLYRHVVRTYRLTRTRWGTRRRKHCACRLSTTRKRYIPPFGLLTSDDRRTTLNFTNSIVFVSLPPRNIASLLKRPLRLSMTSLDHNVCHPTFAVAGLTSVGERVQIVNKTVDDDRQRQSIQESTSTSSLRVYTHDRTTQRISLVSYQAQQPEPVTFTTR